ncbi:Unknown protein sequence [Pseudomonas syringae pv. syringae]|nr:Unknown protein sequence [Pseudomonas syringae pv. syringae]
MSSSYQELTANAGRIAIIFKSHIKAFAITISETVSAHYHNASSGQAKINTVRVRNSSHHTKGNDSQLNFIAEFGR